MSYTNGLDKPSDYFNTVLWTGNATDNRSITGVNFQPDLVWYKERSSTSWHNLQDVVRGASKQIHSNSTEPETTNTGTIKAFQTDGFQIGTEADINENGQTYVAWNWLASNTSGSSNTDGSITSTVSANTTSGFSIVSYTGNNTVSTIGHGLGVTPKMIILKCRNRTDGRRWVVYHSSLPDASYFLYLNQTDAQSTYTPFWNNTAPTSSVFTIGSGDTANNGSGDTYIAYCFAEKKGFSKFGSYSGNGNANGTFVYTGFSPAFIIVKRTDSTESWGIIDNKRQIYNPNNTRLFANLNVADDTSESGIDLLSQGFKIRNSWIGNNASGGSYIYMCFAENPFVTSGGIPTTAR